MADGPEPFEDDNMFVLPPAPPDSGRRRKGRARGRKPANRGRLIAGGVTLAIVLFAVAALIVGGLLHKSSDTTKLVVPPTTTHPSTSTKGKFSCVPGTWPSLYKGEPRTLAKPTDPGVFLWNDAKGWHVRAVDPAGATNFTLQIVASAPIATYSLKTIPAALPKPTVTGNNATVTFTGGPDARGLDFALCQASSFRFDVSVKTGTWSPDHTWVGASGTATGNTIVIQRST